MTNEVWYINGVYSGYSATSDRDEAAKVLAKRFSRTLGWRNGKRFRMGLRRLPEGSHAGAPELVGPLYTFVWRVDGSVEFDGEVPSADRGEAEPAVAARPGALGLAEAVEMAGKNVGRDAPADLAPGEHDAGGRAPQADA